VLVSQQNIAPARYSDLRYDLLVQSRVVLSCSHVGNGDGRQDEHRTGVNGECDLQQLYKGDKCDDDGVDYVGERGQAYENVRLENLLGLLRAQKRVPR
jgi:hypothetical protein